MRSGDLDLAICLVPEWVEDETVPFEILLRTRWRRRCASATRSSGRG
ncbi:MAG: hypothetical protein IPI87_19605 [Betaproteobacteria bacterium]|nr:hypothetical protein [Betaproteobacteria bacterium]